MAEQRSPRWFLNELFAGKPEELYMLVWTLPDKRSRWFNEVDAAAAAVEALTGRDVYVGVGLAGQDYGPSQRCPADQVAGLTAAWADFDVLSKAHSRKSLPASIEQALSVVPLEMPPSVVVATGFRDGRRLERAADRRSDHPASANARAEAAHARGLFRAHARESGRAQQREWRPAAASNSRRRTRAGSPARAPSQPSAGAAATA